ncbi:MAG TPA: BON domain-containing protein [Candidatus Acidoferrales bacterium]|nr:BON domain-containing protein [Candidatus Acidoferrales bacterium]
MRSTKNLLLISLTALVLTFGCAKKVDDTQLATNIKAAMFSDPQTKDSGIQVDVKNGVVTLTGTAASDAAHLEAYKIATNTRGVTKVDDQITVGAPQETAQAAPPPAEQPAPERAPKPLRRAGHTTHAATHHKSAPQSSPAQGSGVAAPASASTPSSAGEQPSAPPPPQPVSVEIPAGTTVAIQTIDPIDSSTAKPGQEFQASLYQPITADGRVIVPAGSNVYVQVSAASEAGHYKGTNSLQLVLSRVEFKGKDYPLATETYALSGGSRGKNTAEKVGGGAALGAIIGAIAGGGKGAAIGAGVGAAGGGVYQGATKAKPIKVAPETKLDFRLSQPLDLSYMP